VCFALRLHTSATPPRVGLTQALGTEKQAVAVCRKRDARHFANFRRVPFIVARNSGIAALTHLFGKPAVRTE
jgi:hypothetical protein